ncbi:hypothetical protein PINS_up002791 [Pythium insidiosum]|nr:hypothetical protein PINS_up002791 [Pythium insidiosum]
MATREFPVPRDTLPTVEVSTEEYLARKAFVDRQVRALVREYQTFTRARRAIDRRDWKKVSSRGHLRLFKQRRDSRDITPPHHRADDDVVAGEDDDEDLDRESEVSACWIETPGTPILMERISTTSSPLCPLLLVGECIGTVEQALAAVAAETREEMALSTQFLYKSVADCALLRTLESPTTDDPFRYLAYKWVVQPSPTSSRVIKHRDAVFMEHTSVTTTEGGERIGVVLAESVDIPSFPEFPDRRCVRMTQSIRVILRQKTPSVVEIYATGNVQLGGRLVASLATRAAAEMLYAVARLPECGEVKALTSVARQLRGERQSLLLTVPLTLSVCSLCRASPRSLVPSKRSLKTCDFCGQTVCSHCRLRREVFLFEGTLGRFHRARCCKTCVTTAALPVNDLCRQYTSSVTSLSQDGSFISSLEAVDDPLRPSDLMVVPSDIPSCRGNLKRSATRTPRKTKQKHVTFADDIEADDAFHAAVARAPRRRNPCLGTDAECRPALAHTAIDAASRPSGADVQDNAAERTVDAGSIRYRLKRLVCHLYVVVVVVYACVRVVCPLVIGSREGETATGRKKKKALCACIQTSVVVNTKCSHVPPECTYLMCKGCAVAVVSRREREMRPLSAAAKCTCTRTAECLER